MTISFSLNKVTVIGNVGNIQELKYLASGVALFGFSVAVNRRWGGQDGGTREETEWFSVTVWRELAENCARVIDKGAKVYVEGRLRTESWEGKDGQKRNTTRLIANNVIVLNAGQRDESSFGPEIGETYGQDSVSLSGEFSNISLIGSAESLPEMRATPAGVQVGTLRVSVKRNWKNPEGEAKEQTQYFTVVAWRKQAESMTQFITNKGAKLYVEGRLSLRTWENEEGQKKISPEIVASLIVPLDPKSKSSFGGYSSPDEFDYSKDIDPNDLPF